MNSRNIRPNVANAIKNYRLEREWTLSQMAIAAGLSASAIQKYEKGTHYPSDLTLHKLKKRLPGFLAGSDGEQRTGSESVTQ